MRAPIVPVLFSCVLLVPAAGASTLDRSPLAADAMFVGPMIPDGVHGESEVRTLLEEVASGMKRMVAERILVDGEHACAPFEFTLHDGTRVAGVDCFRVVGGKLREIRPYYDPRPLLEREA